MLLLLLVHGIFGQPAAAADWIATASYFIFVAITVIVGGE